MDDTEAFGRPRPRAAPERLGPFHIVGELGRGGMGEVYRADQREPVRRSVAIKVLPWRFGRDDLWVRFEAERHAMARLSHPNVASLYEAGETDDGRPYFAMELVDGPAITVYCDRRRLGLRARLALFREVCAGVQHAHEKAFTKLYLASVYLELDRLEEARRLIDELLEVWIREFGEDHLRIAEALTYRGAVALAAGRVTSAQADFERVMEIYRDQGAPSLTSRIQIHANLAETHVRAGDDDAAERSLDAVADGPDGRPLVEVVAYARARADLLRRRGRLDEALAILRRSLEAHRQVLGDDHPTVAGLLHEIGGVHLAAGRRAAARAVLTQALAIREHRLPGSHRHLAATRAALRAVDADDG